MEVAEEATDQAACVHIYVDGKTEPVGEYGKHLDPTDNAVCCYISLEEDQATKIGGKFIGTVTRHLRPRDSRLAFHLKTPAIAYDALVDEVCRKTTAFVAKAVHF